MSFEQHTHTLSVYVANRPGVLARIAQVFSRRGYNIESLVVSPANDGDFSRMTIGLSGASEGLEQIVRQVGKLVDVISCMEHADDTAVVRELALVKVRVEAERRMEVLQIVEHFACKTVDLTDTSMIIMSTGASEKVAAFIRMIRSFEVVELVRTGKVLMARGDQPT
ncbi:MAG: acetolactate synthase small subunit [Deltaproteobacteria bacterium]|nr:acetolactate synthase small subunit [Deltaproteobacteria bacterium]MBN2670270.1 acetolactate synthase small subunit [Deltaproteobacteria bacterium]